MRLLMAAWAYRNFILTSIQNDFRARFARSKFGFAWLVIQPLAQVVIFATILSGVLAARMPGVATRFGYAIYLLAGMLCWTLFSEILLRSMGIFIDNAAIIKKINFPKITLPLILVGSIVVNNLILMLVVLVGIPVLGGNLTVYVLWLPLLTLITIAFATGIGLFVGTLNVFFRDAGQVMGVLLQFWYWFTPIAYPISIVPGRFQWLFKLNPLTILVDGYQRVLLFARAPDLLATAAVAIIAMMILFMSLGLFRRASSELIDVL